MVKQQPQVRNDYRHFLAITTRWMDNDVYRHVNNVHYYSFFDTAVNEYLMREGVLTLDSEHYPHKKYGRVYTPVFKIVRWISLDGPADAPTAAGAPPAAEAAPETRRRRRV